MTINHASAVWGYGTPSNATLIGGQGGLRTGRLFPVAPSTAGGSASIRPYCMPWLAAADTFGVAYPSGIVGVSTAIRLPSPLVAANNVDYEKGWDGTLAYATPVPAVLPVGYTASLYDGWDSSGAVLTRRRTASGFVDATWLPTTFPGGVSVSSQTFGIGFGSRSNMFPTTKYFNYFQSAATGWRKVQMRFRTTLPYFAVPDFGTTIIRLRHNADGSDPGSSSGDTLDHTYSHTVSDYTHVDGSFFWTSDYFDLGQALASTLGTLTYFQMEWDASGSSATVDENAVVDFRLSPRCDVPYPVLVHGQGDLIAPGGYP